MPEHLKKYSPIAGVCAALALALSLGLIRAWSHQVQNLGVADRPLPWDMAGHYERALVFADALRSFSPHAIWDQWFAANQYPPLHAAVLGIWFCLFGSSPWSWILAVALIHATTIYLLFRVDPIGAVAFACLATVTALAPTLIVEPLATLLLVGALIAGARLMEDPSPRRATLLALAMSSVLLTKYNFGLPLLLAVPFLGAASRNRKKLVAGSIAALAAGAVWAGYLQLQDQGWEYFLKFATNRSNAAGMPLGDRASWYLHAFRSEYLTPAWALIAGLALVAWGAMRRRPLALLALLYALLSIGALLRHDYLLVRNLVAPAVALTVAIAAGARATRTARIGPVLRPLAATVLVLAAWTSAPALERATRKTLASADPELVRLSELLSRNFASADQLRVLGSFEQFSAGWVRVLARRADSRPVVRLDWPYPWEDGAQRDGRSASWHPSYLRRLEAWAPQGEERVVAISLGPQSPYRTDGYRRWSEWTTNYALQLPWTGWYVLAEDETFDDGVRARVFDRLNAPLRFEEGWGEVESWGRWALFPRAAILVPPLGEAVDVVLRVGTTAEFEAGQNLRVLVDGLVVQQAHLDSSPWVWQDCVVPLDAHARELRVELEFASKYVTAGGRALALAVQRVELVRRPAPESEDVAAQVPTRAEREEWNSAARVPATESP